jgi:membrane-bound lytic murein transglycosylase D
MMIKTVSMLFAGILFSTLALGSTLRSDSLTSDHSQTDTSLTSPVNPFHSIQNMLYKKRLDTLQTKVPLTYNEHVQAYIDIYLAKRKADFEKIIGLSAYYFPIFEESLLNAGIPAELKYLAIVESELDPHAVSRSGATGPWQFMYTTAKGYGLTMDSYVDERKDPFYASVAAARYLKTAYETFGDWLLAIASYNCGMGAVSRAVERAGGERSFWAVRNYLPLQTRNYVPAFIATVYLMNNYDKHSLVPVAANFSVKTDVIPVTRTVSLKSIAEASGVPAGELSILNPAYKKAVINGTESNPKRLVLPVLDKKAFASLYDILNRDTDQPQVIAASVTEGRTTQTTYKVKEGETLGSIAVNFGVDVQDLKVWNSLKSYVVVPGQSIQVTAPEAPRVVKKPVAAKPAYYTYKVKTGDTLSEIAEKHGKTIAEIKSLNGLRSSVIQPGKVLKIRKG